MHKKTKRIIPVQKKRHTALWFFTFPTARFVTQYRRNIFNLDAIEKLRKYFASVGADFDVELVEMDGERDHAHLLINSSPKAAISKLTAWKGVSRRKIKWHDPNGINPCGNQTRSGHRLTALEVCPLWWANNKLKSQIAFTGVLSEAPLCIPCLKGRGFPRTAWVLSILRDRQKNPKKF